MKPEQLQAIRERVNKATPGPWQYYNPRMYSHSTVNAGDKTITADVRREPDGTFIAHAREDVPALLDEIKWLRGALESVKGIVANREQLRPLMSEQSIWRDLEGIVHEALAGESE